MTRFQPEGWEPIRGHLAKKNPDEPLWPRCTECGRPINHHITRWEWFTDWMLGR